ncbi:MAG: sulfotransferase family protein [Actinomycetota bacterium]
MSGGPIFIGGLSGSGKTPLRAALAAAPGLAIMRHTALWDRYHGRFGDLAKDRNLDRCLRALVADDRVAPLEPDADALRAALREGAPTYARLFVAVHAQHAARIGARRWGEQLSAIERYADPVFAEVPDARMLHLLRDPRDRYEVASRGARRRPGAVGWLTAAWRASAETAERNARAYPDAYLVVRFESLASEPERTLEAICAFVGEERTDAMDAALVAGLGRSAEAARARVPEVAFVDRYAGRALGAHGYDSAPPRLSSRERVSFALFEVPVNRAAMAAWRVLGPRVATAEGG